MSRSVIVFLALLGLGPLAGAEARAETVVEAHQRALADFYAGRYERAAEGLERILAIPLEDGGLRYNLGCVYVRLGKLGPAIYHFERALALDRDDEDARFNLEVARGIAAARVRDEIKGAAGDPFWVRAVSVLGPRSWAALFLALWWAFFALLLVLRQRGGERGAIRATLVSAASLVGVAVLVVGLALGGRLYLGERVRMGIVLPDRLAVREGPDAATKVSFSIHAGLRVRLRGGEGGWVRVRLANGLEGWAPRRDIGVL